MSPPYLTDYSGSAPNAKSGRACARGVPCSPMETPVTEFPPKGWVLPDEALVVAVDLADGRHFAVQVRVPLRNRPESRVAYAVFDRKTRASTGEVLDLTGLKARATATQ